jgi:hypothetical protein
MTHKRLLDTEQAAAVIQRRPRTVREYAQEKKLPVAHKAHGITGNYVFDLKTVAAFAGITVPEAEARLAEAGYTGFGQAPKEADPPRIAGEITFDELEDITA